MKEALFYYRESRIDHTVKCIWKRKNITAGNVKNSLLLLDSIGEITCPSEDAHHLIKRDDSWIFYLIIQGTGTFRHRHETIPFSAGDVIVIAPQFTSTSLNILSPSLTLKTFYIVNTIGIQHICLQNVPEIARFHPVNFNKLTSLCENIVQKMENQLQETVSECSILKDVFAFMYEMEHQCFLMEYLDPILTIYNEINSLPDRVYSIRELAKKSGLSIRTLQRRFKKQIGCSIQSLITICRIGYARKLLQNTYLSVSEIASRCCFKNIAYFSNTFKQETGLSPNEFREKNRNPRSYTNTSNLTSSLKLANEGGIKELSPRKKQILWLINEKRNISIQELADILKINHSAVQKHIEMLKKEKILQRSGPKNGGFWIISRP